MDVFLCELVFIIIPINDMTNFAATWAWFLVCSLQTSVGTKCFCLWIISNMPGLDYDQVLAMCGVWSMSVSGNNSTDPPMVEWECAKVPGDHDNWIALALVRTESAWWHDLAGFKTEWDAPVIQLWYEQVIAQHHPMYFKATDWLHHICG